MAQYLDRTASDCPSRGGSRYYGDFRHVQARGLGWAQIGVGLGSALFWSVLITLEYLDKVDDHYTDWSYIGTGLWSGLLMILPGGLGVVSSKKKTRSWIVGFLVLSIVMLLVDICYLGMIVMGIFMEVNKVKVFGCPGKYVTKIGMYTYDHCTAHAGVVTLYCMCTLLSFMYVVIALWSAGVCLAALCCSKRSNANTNTQRVRHASADAAAEQLVFIQKEKQEVLNNLSAGPHRHSMPQLAVFSTTTTTTHIQQKQAQRQLQPLLLKQRSLDSDVRFNNIRGVCEFSRPYYITENSNSRNTEIH